MAVDSVRKAEKKLEQKAFLLFFSFFPCSATIVISNLVKTFEQETVNARLDTTYYSTLRTVKVAMAQNFANTSGVSVSSYSAAVLTSLGWPLAGLKIKFHV